MEKDDPKQQLLILAIVEQRPGLTDEELKALAVKSLYMDYFSSAQVLQDLTDQGLLVSSLRKGEENLNAQGRPLERIDLSPQGSLVLETLRDGLSPGMLSFLDKLVRQDRKQSELTAKYTPDLAGGYRVDMVQTGKFGQLIRLELNVPDELCARQFCQNWPDRAALVYESVIRLLQDQEEDKA